jgi:hypothetical protein
VAFGVVLIVGFAAPSSYQDLTWCPPVWFLSLYQAMQHRASPAMQEVAQFAVYVLSGLCALTAAAYLASYRRRFASVLENCIHSGPNRAMRLLLRVPPALSFPRPGLERAGVQFGVYALLRNDAQRVCLLVAAGFGWLFAAQASLMAESRAPVPALIPAYLVLLGTRVALEIPAVVQANWIFRVAGGAEGDAGMGIARRMLWLTAAVLVGLPCMCFAWWTHGPLVAVLHTTFVMSAAAILGAVLLTHYRKIPFTRCLPPFRENIPVWLVLHVVAFAVFTRAGAAVEQWFLAQPLRFVLIPVIVAVFLRGWSVWNDQGHESVRFEEESDAVLEPLNLSEAG